MKKLFGKSRQYELFNYILMLLPTLLLYIFLLVILGKTIRLSFFHWSGFGAPRFVGISNYVRLFMDDRFLVSLRNVGLLIIATIIFQVGIAIILAYLLIDIKLKFTNFYKSIIFLPTVISNVAVSLYFICVYDYQYGLLNHLLVYLGYDKVNFLGSGFHSVLYTIIPQTWQYIGLMFIIAYTAFTTVSRDYIDAARIDGINSFQKLTHIYIPVSWKSLSVCFVVAMVGPIKGFDHFWILTNGGGVNQMKHLPATLMVYLGFSSYEYGYGSAIAVVIAVIALILVFTFRELTRKI